MGNTVKRDVSIDVMRGIAIFTMIAANLAGAVLKEPHPVFLRLYGTFAAPLFIMLSGMMVAFSAVKKSYGFSYFFIRGAVVMLIGAFIDVFIYHSYPFATFDVLYLIGFSLIAAFFFIKLKIWSRWITIIVIFTSAPLLQQYFGYNFEISDLHTWNEFMDAGFINIIKRWLIDGWFPLIPWLGFSLLGVMAASIRWDRDNYRSFAGFKTLSVGFFVAVICAYFMIHNFDILASRNGYSEYFYPPTIIYCLTAIGVIIILFAVVDSSPDIIIYKPLRALGEASLFMYVIHLALIEYFVLPFYGSVGIPTYTGIYFILLAVCFACAYLLRIIRKLWQKRPLLIKMLTG